MYYILLAQTIFNIAIHVYIVKSYLSSEDAFVPMLEQTYDGDLFKESFKGQIPKWQNKVK